MSDSGLIVANRDTNWLAKYSGTVVFKPSNKKFYWFDTTMLKWNQFADNIDTTSLSNRINTKLNISDTANLWWGIGKRWVDSMYRVNDSTIGYTINGAPYTFQILGRASSGGGSGTVTSVALSMPSAFSVSGSPITGSGTFNVSGAGTSAQYIRGNGTLATTDTGMIPNFHLKVRSLFSANSPITYNSTTGGLGILNADVIGGKGVATFSNVSFSDNGSGLISLNQPVTPGSCTNCNVTWGLDGRPTAYSNGSGGGGSGVDTIYRVPGKDSIFFDINSNVYAIKDSTGGAAQNLQQVTDIGYITTHHIQGDSALFNGFHFMRSGRVGGAFLSAPQPFSVWGSSISVGFGAVRSYSQVMADDWVQVVVTNNAVNGSGISTGTPSNLFSKISLLPYYAVGDYAIGWDAGINDFLNGVDTSVYKAQLGEIIDSVIDVHLFPSGKVLVISPPFSPGFTGDSIYVNINASVVAAHGGVAIDIWHPMERSYHNGNTGLVQSDSLHPSTTGQELIAQIVAETANTGFYFGNITVSGSDTTMHDKITYGNSTTYGNIIPLGAITQPTLNGGGIRIMNPGHNNGDYQDVRFVPDLAYHVANIRDSFALRHIISQSYQSEFKFLRISDLTTFEIWKVNAAVQLLLGTDAATPPTTDYTSSLGTTYITNALVNSNLKINGNAISDPQRLRIYKNSNDVAAIGFDGTYGLQMGSSSTAGFTAVDISSVDGTTRTPVWHIPHNGTGHFLVGTITDNGSNATLQNEGKISVSAHAIGSNSDSAVTWNRISKEYEYSKINTGADGNGIYSGSGSLPGAVVITGAGNALTMTGTQGSTAAFNVNNTGNGIAIAGTTTGTGSAATFSNSSSGAGVTGTSSSGFGGNFTSTSGIGLRSKITPSSTNTVVDVTNWIRSTSGTAAVGMGIGLPLKLTDDAGNDITTARFTSVFTDATTASPDADFNILTITNGSLTNKFTIKATSQLQFNGYGSATFTGTPTTIANFDASGNIIEGGVSNLLELQSGNIQFNDAYMTSLPNNQIFLKSRHVRLSYTTPDADFSTLSTRQEGYFILPDITANRTFTMFSGTGVDGVEFYIYNGNTSGTFSWSFTGVTPVKASDGTSVSSMVNGVLYHILGVYNGTARWIVVNQ